MAGKPANDVSNTLMNPTKRRIKPLNLLSKEIENLNLYNENSTFQQQDTQQIIPIQQIASPKLPVIDKNSIYNNSHESDAKIHIESVNKSQTSSSITSFSKKNKLSSPNLRQSTSSEKSKNQQGNKDWRDIRDITNWDDQSNTTNRIRGLEILQNHQQYNQQYSPQTPSNPDRKTGAVESDNEQWPLSLQPRINQSSPRPLLITATGRKDGILESNRDDPLRHLNIPQSLHYSKYNQQQSDTNRNVQQQNRKNISLSQSPNIRNQSLTAQFPRRYQQNFTQREFLKISTFPLVPESVRPTHYSKKFSPLYHTEAGSTFTPPSYTFQRPMFSSQTARTLQAQSFYIPVLQSKHLYMQPIIPGPNGVFEKQNYGLMQRMQEDEEAVKEIRGRFEALYQMNREERNYNTNEADIIDYDKYEKENETLLQQISESENTITQKNSAIIEDNKNQERIESYLQKQYYEEEQEQLAKLNEQQKSQDEIEGQSSEVEQEIKQGFEHLTDLPEMIELGNTIRSNMSETIRSGKDMSTPTSRRRFNKSPVQRTDSKASLIATLRKDMISKDGSGKFMITEDLIPKQEWWVEEEKKDKSKERVQQIDFSVPPTVSPRNHLI